MKKNLFALALALGMLISGVGHENSFSLITMAEANGSADSPQTAIEEKASEAFSLAALENREFYFASGAGGWRTVLQIRADGSFSGAYSDSDMCSFAEGYPKGTYYLCEFEGIFTDPVQINEYTYSMRIAEIRCAMEPNTTEIIDEVLYHYSTPYGIEGAQELLIYLPGAPIAELPEEYMSWVRNDIAEPDAPELPFFGLYNAAEQNGFSSYDLLVRLDAQLASTRELADALNASLADALLTQGDMNLKSCELYELWEYALNAVLHALQNTLPAKELAALTEEQQAWIAEREKAIEEAGADVLGDSIYPLIVNTEAARLTEERVSELYARLK